MAAGREGYISDEMERLLLDSIDPREFFDLMGWNMRRQGLSYRGCCPIHGGDNRQAFEYSLRRQRFYCWTHCGRIGNFIQAYARAKGVTRLRAAKELADWLGIPFQGKAAVPKPSAQREKPVVAERPAEVARLPLVSAREREGLMPLEHHKRFSREAIERFQIRVSRSGRYRNRIVFPIFDIDGRWVGNNGRWMGEDYAERGVPKYLYSPYPFETRHVLYGAHLAKDSPYWILHEGVTDVIRAWEHGYEAVAILGSTLTEEQAELIRRNPKPVVLGFDGDAAGRKATRQAIALLFRKHVTDVSVMMLPEGKDPGSMTKEEYDQAFDHRLPALAYMSRHGNSRS